ncbi:alpha/beta fold hydrolase [Xanthomonas sp. 3307]|uniref:alpha/beta hydrolase n=1 Tax=Xanthomonas sp. 3307 TaxID=3035316 RepID=UPI00160976A4|nr:alpha/beta fold hydrolase [Xanthomonas sp. 3307]MBB5943289.1 pimeloyl-ACP methyl ester carboxylesterase [Xanthomonas sp. 3307]
MGKPVLYFLHALGSSGREWSSVIEILQTRFDCIALDIPGFGNAPALQRSDVEALVDWFAGEVARDAPHCWYVVGHSMGGKIATLAAARARDGMAGLAGLAGVVLVAASPPAPEPMDESRRQTMLSWFDAAGPTRQQAEQFIDDNCVAPLPTPPRDGAVDDVLRSTARAWNAWLTHGSREDCAAQAGCIAVPALVVAGSEDGDLDEAAQRRWNLPHYRDARLTVVAQAAHLIPYERPQALAALIAAHVDGTAARRLPDDFVALLNAERVAPQIRKTLLHRHAGPSSAEAGVLSERQSTTLAALVERVLDGAGDAKDIARRIDVDLAKAVGDGWRFADLPPDRLAWPLGLDVLDTLAGGFAALHAQEQDRWLHAIALRDAGDCADCGWSAAQLASWFEDVRAETVRIWTSLPVTMAALGYDGFAVGGLGAGSPGYQETAADRREAWQLRPKAQP